MSFGSAISTCFHKYGDFSGRARRSEFWWWQLFVILVVNVPMLIGVVFFVASTAGAPDAQPSGGAMVLGIIFYAVAAIIALALLVPNLAVGCRRLHDKGMSGWLQLLILVPCGNIVLIVLWLLAGQPQDNQYGPPPA